MREIRVENLSVQDLVHIVSALKKDYSFFIEKKLYKLFESEAEVGIDGIINFVSWYENFPINTQIKVRVFCEEYYLIESIMVDNNLIYGYSEWKNNSNQKFIIRSN